VKPPHPIERLDAVHREYLIAQLAVERLRLVVAQDPSVLQKEKGRLGGADLRACRRNLQHTYIIRLFAEFEAALRTYWRDVRKRRTWNTIPTEVLIQSVAAYRGVPGSDLGRVQEVRRLRNNLVHLAAERGVAVLMLDECLSRLGAFLSFLPLRW
jgi:hypothetical protein